MSDFGDFVINRRINLGYTLRAFCKKYDYDAGNFSKMERGLLLPPIKEKLEKLADALELISGSTKSCIGNPLLEKRFELIELAEKERQPLLVEISELQAQLAQTNEKLEKLTGFCNKILSGDRHIAEMAQFLKELTVKSEGK